MHDPRSSSRTFRGALLASVLTACLAAAPAARAQTNFWWTNGVNGAWSEGFRWTNNVGLGGPVNGGSNDYILTFLPNASYTASNNLAAANFFLNQMVFNAAGGTVTIAGPGKSLVFTNNTAGQGPRIFLNSAATINHDITLGATLTITNVSGKQLLLSNFSNNVIRGAGGLVFDAPDAASLTTAYDTILRGTNTYSGGTTVNRGRVRNDNGNPFIFGTGPVTINEGGQFLFAGGTGATGMTNAFTIAGRGVLDSWGNGGALRIEGNNTISGTVALAADSRIGIGNANNTGKVAGVISGAHALEVFGASAVAGEQMQLNAANTYSGGTTIQNISLRLGHAQALGLPSAGVPLARVLMGGQLDVNGFTVRGLQPLELAGFGVSGISGALVNNSGTGVNVTNITLIGSASVSQTGGGRIDAWGTADGGGFYLSKVGDREFVFRAGATNFAGIYVNGGTLRAESSTHMADIPVQVNGGAMFDVYNRATTNPVTINGGTLRGGGPAVATVQGNVVLLAPTNAVDVTTLLLLNGSVSGPGALRKTGNGLLEMTNANTYAGLTIIDAGTLQFDRAEAVPAGGSITVNTGGGLVVTGVHDTVAGWLGDGRILTSSQGALVLRSNNSEAFDLSSYANLSLGSLAGTTNTFSGTVTPGANGYFIGGGGGTLVFDSTLVGGGTTSTFGRGGGGTVILAQDSTAGGPATIWAGTLQLGTGGTAGWLAAPSIANSGTLSVVRSDTVYLPTMSGSGSLSMGGNGVLMVTNANTHYGANNVVSNGTLWVTGNGRLGAFNPVTGANPGDFQIGNTAARSATGVIDSASAVIQAGVFRAGNSGNGVMLISNGTVNSRSWFVIGQNANTTGQVDLVGGTVNVNQGGGGQHLQVGAAASKATLNITGGQLNLLPGALLRVGDAAGAKGTVNQGGGTVYAPQGVLVGNNGTAFGVYNLSGGILLATNVTRASGTGTVNFAGGVVKALGNHASFISNLSTANVTAGGAFIDSDIYTVTVPQDFLGAGALTKQGRGTLILTGTNTYAGGTVVDGGLLQFVNTNGIAGSGFNLTVNGGGSVAFGYTNVQTMLATRVATASAGTIALLATNANEAIDFNTPGLSGAFLGAAANLTYGGTFTPNGTTYRLGGGGAVLTYTNAIGSGSNLVIGGGSGGGTPSVVVLTAANAADSTTLEAHALRATDGVGLSSGNLAIDGGVLETSGTFNRGLGTGASQVQFLGNGGGFSAFGAPLSVDIGGAGGTLTWGSGSFTPGTEITLNAASANSTVSLANPVDLNGNSVAVRVDATAAGATATAAGAIQGTGDLAKRGAGVLVLSAANSYSGSTAVEQGILRLSGGANRLPTSTALTLANVAGAALDLNDQNQTVASLSGGGGAGGNVDLGSGTLTVNQTVNTTFGGVVYGMGGLTKQGTGTLTLTNASVYTGLTAIEGGTLQLAAMGGNQAGLSEGWLNGTTAWLPPMPRSNTVLSARFNSANWGVSAGPTPIWPAVWPVNTTIGYQGYVYNNTGSNVTWTFALVCDDNSRLAIDGVQVVLQGGTAWATNSIVLTPGAHAIDYRISNGAGGAGAGGASAYQLFGGGYGYLGGFAFDPLGRSSVNGAFYQVPTDPGDGSFFTTGLNLLPADSLVSISPNAVLDLNGAAQIIGGLTDPLASPGSGGLVTNTAAAAPALLALAPAAGTVRTFTGSIDDDGTAGRAITVASYGPGTQILAGTNTYSGGTFINNGTLRFAVSNALPASSAVLLNGGALAFDWADAQGTLTTRVVAGSSGALALTASNAAENVNFNLPGYAGMFLGAADDVVYDATLTPAGAPNLYSAVRTNLYRLGGGGGTLTFSNSLVDAFSLTVGSGAGRVVLTTDNSLPGALTVNSGAVLDLGGHSQTASAAVVLGTVTNSSATMATLASGMNGIFSVHTANANTWTNLGSLTGPINLTKMGPGVQTLVAPNSHTGTNTVNGGTLALGFSVAGPGLGQTNNILPAGAALRLGGGILQVLGARGMTNSQALGDLAIDAGASAINMTPAAIVGAVNLSLGAISRNAHGAMNFSVSPTGVVTATGAPLVNGILPYATVNLSDWATTNASGQIVANTTYVNDTWAAGNNTTAVGSPTVNGGTTYSLRFADGTARTVTLNGLNTIQGGGILFAPSAADGSTIGGTGWITSATGELLVIDNDSSKDRKNGTSSTISAVIADNGGPVSLTVASMVPNALNQMSQSSANNSQVNLTGTNLYSGGTYLAGGSIAIATDRNLGAYPVAVDPDNITVLGGYNAIRGSLAAVTSGVNRGISLQNNSVLMLSALAGGANNLTIQGVISGSGYVVSPPNQDGILILSGSNTFSGVLEVEGNVRAIDGVGLSPNANLKLGDTGQRGMLETTGTFTRALGAGPGQVQWSANNAYIGAYNNGGFSAVNGALTVNIGGQTNALTWNTNSLAMGQFAFGQLTLQNNNATHPLTWLNPIDFAGGSRVIANNQSLNGNAPTIMAGTLYNGSLSKGWGGLLWLTATNNLGTIGISGGAVRGEFGVGLGNSSITLNGGVLETSGLLTNSLGTQARQIQIIAPGASGFSAYGAPLVLNLDNGAPLVWQVNSYFSPAILSLQETTANAALTLLNPIDLTGSNRLFQVNSTNASLAPVIAGVIRGSGMAGQSALTKQGVGMLVLAATNTYDGPTFLNAGTLSVGHLADGGLGSGIGASPASLTNLVFSGGRLQYTGPDVVIDRGFQIAGTGGGWIDVPSNTLTMSGAYTNTAAGAFTKIGNGTLLLSGPGRLVNGVNVNAGTLILSNNMLFVGATGASIGQNNGDYGRMILTGTAVWSSTNMPDNVAGPVLNVGNAGKGVLIVEGNAILTNRLYVGNTATGAGAIYQRGGTVLNWDGRASDGRIGMTGYGYYELAAGTLTNLGYTQLGRDLTGIGVQAQYGGTFLQGNVFQGSLQISRGGVGIYHMAGGTFASVATIDLGNASDNGTANGMAIFDMMGGTATIAGNVNMADRANMHSVLNLNGGVLTANQVSKANRAGSLAVVNFDGGTLQARQGGNLFNIGVNAPTAAYVYDGGATIDVQGFSVTNTQALLEAPGSGVTGIALAPLAGYIGSPYVHIAGGGGTGATAFAEFDSFSGMVTGIVVTSQGYGYSTAPAVTLMGGGSTNVLLGPATIGANTSGGLTKTGNGVLMMSASNTYTGTTRVMAGVLGLTGAGSVQQSTTLQIDAGAKMVVTGLTATMHLVSGQTLQGNGTFEGGLITDNGSAIRPGSSAGTLTMLGNLTADAGATFTFELNGLAAGTQYDQLLFGGSGAYTLTLNDASLAVQLNFVPGVGDSFQIVSGFGTLAGTTGEFSGRPDGSTFTVNSTEFQIDYNANDITLTVVPEPASLGLVSLLGLAAWLLRRRPLA